MKKNTEIWQLNDKLQSKRMKTVRKTKKKE